MDFYFGFAWCFCGWLAHQIGEKKCDFGKADWQTQIFVLIYGPLMLIYIVMEYLKRKTRAKNPIIGSHYNDIFTWWDRLFE